MYLLESYALDGDIVQTHLLSPRSSGYLCALLAISGRKHKYYVYGAGAKQKEFASSLESMCITNIRVNAESFRHTFRGSLSMDNVACIFLTPPSSYSSVKDPIDLICARGGDLTILEMLTEAEMNENSKLRVTQILREQRESLEAAMAKPQIQFILYETYSIIDAENDVMAKRVIDNYNGAVEAKYNHLMAIKENSADLKDLISMRKKQYENPKMSQDSDRTGEGSAQADDSSDENGSDGAVDTQVLMCNVIGDC